MEETRTDLALRGEISLYYDLYIPETVTRPAPLLIAVHGYGQTKRWMMREAKAVAGERFVIASVQGPHQHFQRTGDSYRIGFAWLTDHRPEEYVRLHHRFLLDLIERHAAEHLIDRSQVFLYGFSQSSALNFRFAFTYPEVLRGLVAACGGIPGDLDSSEIYRPFQAETFYVYGDNDEYYSNEKFAEFDEKLRRAVPNYRSRQYRADHEITDEMRDDIAAFIQGLIR
ncbi:MAG: alpha/beta hydrolase [Pyrinomonadaceae bacterium]